MYTCTSCAKVRTIHRCIPPDRVRRGIGTAGARAREGAPDPGRGVEEAAQRHAEAACDRGGPRVSCRVGGKTTHRDTIHRRRGGRSAGRCERRGGVPCVHAGKTPEGLRRRVGAGGDATRVI